MDNRKTMQVKTGGSKVVDKDGNVITESKSSKKKASTKSKKGEDHVS